MANQVKINIRPKPITGSNQKDIYLVDHGILCINGSIEKWAYSLNAHLYNWHLFTQGKSWIPSYRHEKRLEILEFIEQHCKDIKQIGPKYNGPIDFNDDGTVNEERLRLSIESEVWFLEQEEKT